ncbi:MAG: Hpt domain-containing protein [Cloacibacillus sp.]
MKQLFDALGKWGCNVDDALVRLLGDEELYIDCLESVQCDPAFYALGDALRAGDKESAFENAHTLKGVLGNLSLTPLSVTVSEMVEPLRGGSDDGLMPVYEQLMAQRKELEDILSQYKK